MEKAKRVVHTHHTRDRPTPHHVKSKPSLDLDYTIAFIRSLRHYFDRVIAQLYSTHWRRGPPRASSISPNTATARSTQEMPRSARTGSDAIFRSKATRSIVRDLLGSGATAKIKTKSFKRDCAQKLSRTPLVKPDQSQAAMKSASKELMRKVLTYLMPSLRLFALFAIFRRRFAETRSSAGFLACFLLGEHRNSQLQNAMLTKSEICPSPRTYSNTTMKQKHAYDR